MPNGSKSMQALTGSVVPSSLFYAHFQFAQGKKKKQMEMPENPPEVFFVTEVKSWCIEKNKT